MQKMSSVLALQPNFSDTDSKFVQDFWLKLKLMEDNQEEVKLQSHAAVAEEENRDGDDESLELDGEIDEEEEGEDDEDEEEEDEFSFSRAFGEDSLISAEEAFLNGQIRPIFPLFNQDLLLPDADAAPAVQPEGPFCEWRGKPSAAAVVDPSPDVCKKSNSTGFSKLRRFRELVLRSNSDGKDKFAFLPHHHGHHNPEAASGTPAKKTAATASKKKKKVETSAFEKIYARRKQEEKSGKRASYLTYKQVGFFASVNGLSKNVHPY
ncbi:unnamed protein product [Linum tenue]|uniref:Uncharacterized protein n=1 Tax=Linum tenue TaxID=586396 RepID=A0AAV0LMH6_9ROSI|nr:unnamed protein product [Linum tenue]